MRKIIEKCYSYLKNFFYNQSNRSKRRIFSLLLCLILLCSFFWIIKKEIWIIASWLRKNKGKQIINCPVRGPLTVNVYNSAGNFTEEYYRVKIVKQLIKVGFSQHYMNFYHRIQVGHKGRSSFIPDLVIKNKSRNGYFLVLEVKRDSDKIKEALLYQLNPAIKILNARYGIYYDGSKNSSCFKNDVNDIKKVKNFNFFDIPTWFYNQWRYS